MRLFFFSSRRRHTRFDCDWSSDVCSSDLRWLAYTSNENGRDEIYVVPFLGTGGKWQVTTTGGHSSRWSPRSEEHTSELQSQSNLVCRLLLEKKKTHVNIST